MTEARVISIKNSSVTPEVLASLPGKIKVSALVQTNADVGADKVQLRASILTTGFVFQRGGTVATIPMKRLGSRLFHGSEVLDVVRSASTQHRFFEVIVQADRLSNNIVVETSSPRPDSVAV